MALGREDVQAAQRHHLVVLGVGLRLEMLVDALVVRFRHAVERVEVKEIHVLLVVDEPLVALRQPLGDLFGQALLPRHELGVAAEQNIGAAARHVRGDRDRAFPAGLGDELGFLGVVFRVQHDVLVHAAAGRRAALQAALVEHRGELLGFLDGNGPHQHRASIAVLLENLADDRVPLFLLGPVDEIGVLDPSERPVRRDDDDVEFVDLGELLGLGVGGAGHAG